MPWNVKAWYRDRVLKNESLPDDLWRHVVAGLWFLHGLSNAELCVGANASRSFFMRSK